MKLLFAVHGAPPELVGGTENSVFELARALVRGGDDVVVAAGTLGAAGEARIGSGAGVRPDPV
jgi:hypothetical protein